MATDTLKKVTQNRRIASAVLNALFEYSNQNPKHKYFLHSVRWCGLTKTIV